MMEVSSTTLSMVVSSTMGAAMSHEGVQHAGHTVPKSVVIQTALPASSAMQAPIRWGWITPGVHSDDIDGDAGGGIAAHGWRWHC